MRPYQRLAKVRWMNFFFNLRDLKSGMICPHTAQKKKKNPKKKPKKKKKENSLV
jgi:hypothetical protein